MIYWRSSGDQVVGVRCVPTVFVRVSGAWLLAGLGTVRWSPSNRGATRGGGAPQAPLEVDGTPAVEHGTLASIAKYATLLASDAVCGAVAFVFVVVLLYRYYVAQGT